MSEHLGRGVHARNIALHLRALLPKLIDSGDGLIVTVTSIAALEVYDGGSGYTSAKLAGGIATWRGDNLPLVK